MNIEGIAEPVVVSATFWSGRLSATVGGQPAEQVRRNEYLFPTTDGRTVEAKLRGSLFDPYPTVEINGVKHRTGPKSPIWLTILTFLPIVLGLVRVVGLFPGILGFAANFAIARSAQSNTAKALQMVGVLVLVFIVSIVLGGILLTVLDRS